MLNQGFGFGQIVHAMQGKFQIACSPVAFISYIAAEILFQRHTIRVKMKPELEPAVIRMMEDTARVVETTAELASQAGESLHEIVKTVEDSVVQVQHITGVSHSQSEISVGISGNIESVSNVAEKHHA